MEVADRVPRFPAVAALSTVFLLIGLISLLVFFFSSSPSFARSALCSLFLVLRSVQQLSFPSSARTVTCSSRSVLDILALVVLSFLLVLFLRLICLSGLFCCVFVRVPGTLAFHVLASINL